jgi:hypothetical protein
VADDLDSPEREEDERGCVDGRVLDYLQRHGVDGRIDAETQLYVTREHKELLERERGRKQALGIGGTVWTNLGPTNGSGRATAVAFHPTTAGTLIAGAAGGGAWKTTDSGANWTPLTETVADLSVGAIVYAPSDGQKVYLGTGEGGSAVDFIPGIGLLYSIDGGTNWTLPSTVIATQFFRISVSPSDPNDLVVATNKGVMRSTAGQNGPWTVTLPFSSTGITQGYGTVTDLVRDPTNALVLYATTYDDARWCARFGCSNPFNYKSPSVVKSIDGGSTWSEVMTGIPLSDMTTRTGRMSIALAPSSTATLYVSFETYTTTGAATSQVYKTTTGGTAWSPTAMSTSSQKNYMNTQGWYGNSIVVSPTDPLKVTVGGVGYAVTADGGGTWAASPWNNVHVDSHDLKYDAAGALWIANDGGIWSSATGATAVAHNTGLVTRQFYTIAMDSANRNRVFGGQQDNGTWRRGDGGGTSWNAMVGGDGFDCPINDDASSVAFGTVQYGNVYRTSNAGAATPSYLVKQPIWPSSESLPFFTRTVIDPNARSTIYTVSTRVWKSTTNGDAWTPLPITMNDGNTWNAFQISAIAVARSNSQIIMVAKSLDFYYSTNGGTSWAKAPNGGGTGLPFRFINCIEIDPTNPTIVYVALGGTSANSVYYSTNGGASWTARGTGLPTFSALVVRVDPTDANTLYCGTDVGVYRSTNGGANWSAFGTGMPAASVYDIAILRDGTKLRAATHGRGMWELTVTSPTNNAPSVTATPTPPGNPLTVALGAAVSFGATFSDADGDPMVANWIFPDDFTTQTAVSGSSVPHTFNRAGRYPVTLVVRDSHGGVGSSAIEVLVSEPSDACATPAVLPASGPFPYTVTFENETGSKQGSDPGANCAGFSYQASNWFSFTPPANGTYVFTLCGSHASTVLAVYTAATSCSSYVLVGGSCQTRFGGTHDATNVTCTSDSTVSVALTMGTTYYIEVTNYFGNDLGLDSLTVAPTGTPFSPVTVGVNPAVGSAAGGQIVTLSGSGFSGGATVSFGGSAATGVTVINSNLITCTVPAHAAGAVDVAVTSSGTGTLRSGYTYTGGAAPAAPTGVVASVVTTTHTLISWTAPSGADSYQIYRSASLASYVLAGTVNSVASGTINFDDNAVSAGTAYLYKVVALNGGTPSPDSNVDLVTTVLFTDDPLVAQTTPVKAAHLTELRTAVNAVRTLAALSAAVWTDNAPSGVNIKAVHVTELRTALAAARTPLGLSALTYTNPTLTPQTSIVNAIDFTEVRNGVK